MVAVRSITGAPEIRTLRIRQTVEVSYRDMPDFGSVAIMLIEAQRDPPATRTKYSTGNGSVTISLMIDNELWTQTSDKWARSEIGDMSGNLALRAYRELGDMSLVAPLTAQIVIDAGQEAGIEEVTGIATVRFSAGTELMLKLLTQEFESRQATQLNGEPGNAIPPADYTNRYEADLWVDPTTGFVLRERTVVEYTDERLHGQAVGTGPATFTTNRDVLELNPVLELSRPHDVR